MWRLHQVEGRGWNPYMHFMANLASMYLLWVFVPNTLTVKGQWYECVDILDLMNCVSKDCYITRLPHKVKTQYVHFRLIYMQTTFFYLGRFLKNEQTTSSALQYLKASYQTLCPYSLLPWEWIDLKLDVKWKYLPCLTFAHTAFFAYCILTLLCTAEIPEMVLLWHVILGVLYKSTQIELKLDRQCFHDFIFVMVQRCKVRSYT